MPDSDNCYDKEKAEVTSWWSWGADFRISLITYWPLNQYLSGQGGSEEFPGRLKQAGVSTDT